MIMLRSLSCHSALLLLLAVIGGGAAAPATHEKQQQQVEKFVRVYPINQEQYDALLKLTDGKNYIAEGRLISGGFASVSDGFNSLSKDLSSGWNSFLRIVGLSPNQANREVDTKYEGHPLCVIRSTDLENINDLSTGRSVTNIYQQRSDYDDDTSLINCLVVVKHKDNQENDPSYVRENYANNYALPYPPYPVADYQNAPSTAYIQNAQPEPVTYTTSNAPEPTTMPDEYHTDERPAEASNEQPAVENVEEVPSDKQPTTRAKTTKRRGQVRRKEATESDQDVESTQRQLPPPVPYPGGYGYPNYGPVYGQQPYGQSPYYPQQPYPQSPYIQQPYGQAPFVQQPYGQPPYVQQPYPQQIYNPTGYLTQPYAPSTVPGQPYGYAPAVPSPYPFGYYDKAEEKSRSLNDSDSDDVLYQHYNNEDYHQRSLYDYRYVS